MNAIPIWTLLLLAATGWFGWSVLAAARAGRRRTEALSEHARGLPEAMLVPLHDHLLDTALEHYNERELRAGKTRVEFAVILRDQIDERAGREHGALNQARIRSRLLPAAYRLRGYPNPFRVREFRETFLLAPLAQVSAPPVTAASGPGSGAGPGAVEAPAAEARPAAAADASPPGQLRATLEAQVAGFEQVARRRPG